jgi:hypothetical protein
MPKTSEPAARDCKSNRGKRLIPLTEAGKKEGGNFLRSQYSFPVFSRRLSQRALRAERGKPVKFLSLSKKGRPIARKAYGFAGKGCLRKRRLSCNGKDTG